MKNTDLLDKIIVGRVEPHIYAFTTNTIPDYLKVGDTYRPVAVRLNEWKRYYPELTKQYDSKAKVADDVYFRDYSVHRFLELEKNRKRLKQSDLNNDTYFSNEFFKGTSANDVKEAIHDISSDYANKTNKYQFYNASNRLTETFMFDRTETYEPRPNQKKTIDAFKTAINNGRTNLLMYAVMRFGKTFTSMCCAVEMKADFVVIVSAKADIMLEWKKTVESHVKFSDYDFITSDDLLRDSTIIPTKLSNGGKIAIFLTLQDLQGDTIKDKHQQIFGRKVDLLIVDETHFGARAEKFGAVLRGEKDVKEKGEKDESLTLDDVSKEVKAFNTHITLHLSGTPYRILMGNEFSKEDIIAFYQFTDIVEDQEKWDSEHILSDDVREWDNPYYGFPQMVRFAFNPNESSRKRMEELRKSGTSFAFSALFKPRSIRCSDDGSHKKFIYEQEILDLLEVIDGSKEDDELLGFLDYDKIKEGKMCRHIVCVLPYCASCDALEALIHDNKSKFCNLNQYEIINISGVDRPREFKSPSDIKNRIRECEDEDKKTITLTVNRMLTGSTVEQWDTMLFFKDTASPQEYDQAIFRLQNQYIKTYVNEDDQEIKYNMKPQTLLVDFDPNRVFLMQEQKAQIYNVNVDEAGNSKLANRIAEELRISPIIVLNHNRMERIQATDILKAVSEYSRNRGVAEETLDIPVDLSLMNIESIREVIENENELGSKAGLNINNAEGEGQDMEMPNGDEDSSTPATPEAEIPATPGEDKKSNDTKDPVKQFRSYYARILFFSFLTRSIVISLNDIISCIDEPDNARVSHNLGIKKLTLQTIQNNVDKFTLRSLDYKIQNLNHLSHDISLKGTDRAAVAVQKFGKLGESEVITPRNICNDMVGLIPENGLKSVLDNDHKILDIAGKAGEFALALFDRYGKMSYATEALKNTICTIPTSGLTYEFTRMVYSILGLNIDCIASKFTSYDLLGIKDEDSQGIGCGKISKLLSQDKPFSKIKMTDEAIEGDKKVKFDVVVGNPPYQKSTSTHSAQSKPIYNNFVSISKAMHSNYISLIIPSRWFAGGMGLDTFRDTMRSDKRLEIIKFFANGKDCFPDTSTGGICYFLWNKNHNDDCSFTTIIAGKEYTCKRNLEEFPIVLRDNTALKIVKEMNQLHQKNYEDRVCSINVFGYASKQHGSSAPTKNGYELLSSRGFGYVAKDTLTQGKNLVKKYKVIVGQVISEHAAEPDRNGQFRLLSSLRVLKPNQICNFSYLVIDSFTNESAAENCKQYFSTRFVRYLILQAVSSIHLSKEKFCFVPIQDFSRSWTDVDLYAKYGLTSEEITFIESTIKPMQ